MTANDEPREPMQDVQHTHPYTGETFGAVYRRGPAIADGGTADRPRAGGRDEDDGRPRSTTGDRPSIGSIDHVGPAEERPNAVWARGRDGNESFAPDGNGGRSSPPEVDGVDGDRRAGD